MKKIFFILAAMAMCFTSCSSGDDDAKKDNDLTIEKLVGVWVTDYSQSGTEGDLSWNRVVEDYKFDADGTGYYECYRLDGEKYVDASSVRDNDSLHFTISGNTVTITGDKNNMKQTLTYTDGKLTVQGKPLQKATAEQVAFIHELYAEWSGGNSAPTANITYIDHGEYGYEKEEKEVTTSAQWLNAATVVEGQPLGIKGDWYVTGYCEINEPIKATYHLRIILCDDAVLKVKNIIVEGVNNLIINGQKRGTGQLIIDDPKDGCPGIGPDEHGGGYVEIHGGNITAKGSTGCAAIGGGHHDGQNLSFSKIYIYGGVINATGGDGAAGIGGGVLSVMDGEIWIYGGDIHAQGGGYTVSFSSNGGAGIGGGCNSPARRVVIIGGNIHATGGREASGIGCGQGAETSGHNGDGHVDIYDGYVEAYGKDHAAGIGGGDGVYLDEISIRGGTIKAYGGVNAAGIGGGEGAKGGRINISGGTVYAYAGADGAGIGGGEDGDGGEITISGGLVFAYGNYHSDGFGAGIGGGQDGNSGKITIRGGEVHAYGGDDAAGIGTGEETTSGPNIKADNITISGGTVEAVGGGYGAGVGAGQDAEVGTITVTTKNGPVHVSGRAGNDCDLWAGSIGAYDVDARGTLNIGNGVKVIGITDFNNGITWTDIPVELNPARWIYERCHVQLKTCDHPGYTAETCVFCKH